MRLLLIMACLLAADGARANHPMFTDDTEVLDRGVWQLELHGERSRHERNGLTTRSTLASIALSYGVAKDLEIQIEQPYVRFTESDGDTESEIKGRTDVLLELKWNFYERDGFGLLLKPVLSLPTGSDAIGGDYARFGLELAAAKELGELELLGQLIYASNRNDEGNRESLWRVSGALLWSATERLRLFVDAARTTHPRPEEVAVREWAFGFLYDVSSSLDFGLGISQGLSESADDRGLRAGLRLRW
jgi:hypothetical protein